MPVGNPSQLSLLCLTGRFAAYLPEMAILTFLLALRFMRADKHTDRQRVSVRGAKPWQGVALRPRQRVSFAEG